MVPVKPPTTKMVPPNEFARDVEARGMARTDWPALKVILKFTGQFLHRGITERDILLKRHDQNHVQFAAEFLTPGRRQSRSLTGQGRLVTEDHLLRIGFEADASA
jgi:hypothetical protein